MEQRCNLYAVWLTWLGLPALALVVGLRFSWLAAGFALIVGVAAQCLYVRWFPSVSPWVGYGRVEDIPAAPSPMSLATPVRVTLYSASACPFCPIVRRRLIELRQRMGFDFEETDVTFRPEIVRSKGLRSVPVIEAGGRMLVGNATSEQLAELIAAAAGTATVR